MSALVRPRSLSAESTRVLRQIAIQLKLAAPLSPATAKTPDSIRTSDAAPAGASKPAPKPAPAAITPINMDLRR